MNRLSLVALFLFGALSVSAQTVEPSPLPNAGTDSRSSTTSSSAAESPHGPDILPGLPADEGPLASPPPPGLSALQQLDQAFKESSLGKAADEARLHAQWRKLANIVISDPDLTAARAQAERARTDSDKRRGLRLYYTMLFDRMRARADSEELKTFLEQKKTEHLALLAQPKVRPETAVPTPKPTPATAAKASRKAKPPEPELPH